MRATGGVWGLLERNWGVLGGTGAQGGGAQSLGVPPREQPGPRAPKPASLLELPWQGTQASGMGVSFGGPKCLWWSMRGTRSPGGVPKGTQASRGITWGPRPPGGGVIWGSHVSVVVRKRFQVPGEVPLGVPSVHGGP